MSLFDDDNELDDDEIRRLLKRGLKKKEDINVNVARDFFGVGERDTQDQQQLLGSNETESSLSSRISEKSDILGSKDENATLKQVASTRQSIAPPEAAMKQDDNESPSDVENDEVVSETERVSGEMLEGKVKELEQSVSQLEQSEMEAISSLVASETLDDEGPSKVSVSEVVDESLRIDADDSTDSSGDTPTRIDSGQKRLHDASTRRSAEATTTIPFDKSVMLDQIEEMRVLMRAFYKLLESIAIQVSMLSGDKEGLPHVISKILVDLSNWNDLERYPEASKIYTELSRLRSRIRQLPNQSVITEMLQEALGKDLPQLKEREMEAPHSTSSSVRQEVLSSSDATTPTPKEASESASASFSGKMETPVIDEEIQIGSFQRAARARDYWSYIMSSGQLMESYQHISDVVIPLYWRYALIEIHRYRIEDPVLLRYVIKIPAEILSDIIRKLLREAPTSRLLQRIKQKRLTDQLLSEFLPNELRDRSLFLKIRSAIERYLEYFTNVQKGILNFEDVKGLGEQSLKNFELGPNEIETRIPLVALNALRELKSRMPNDDEIGEHGLSNEKYLEAVCSYLTIYLVNELNRHFINESKFYTLLERLKRS